MLFWLYAGYFVQDDAGRLWVLYLNILFLQRVDLVKVSMAFLAHCWGCGSDAGLISEPSWCSLCLPGSTGSPVSRLAMPKATLEGRTHCVLVWGSMLVKRLPCGANYSRSLPGWGDRENTPRLVLLLANTHGCPLGGGMVSQDCRETAVGRVPLPAATWPPFCQWWRGLRPHGKGGHYFMSAGLLSHPCP